MKASPDRIKARAQELRAQGNKVQASLDMNAGATRSQARPAQGKEHQSVRYRDTESQIAKIGIIENKDAS